MTERHDDDLLRPEDVAREYGVGIHRVRRLAKSGELPHLRVGRMYKIPRHCFVTWINEHLTYRDDPERP